MQINVCLKSDFGIKYQNIELNKEDEWRDMTFSIYASCVSSNHFFTQAMTVMPACQGH